MTANDVCIRARWTGRLALAILTIGAFSAAMGAVPYPVAKSYEDTLRVALVHHDGLPMYCAYDNAQQSRRFVHSALVGLDVKYVPTERVKALSEVIALWPGRKPHVVVHSNGGDLYDYNFAGWASALKEWIDTNAIGFVDIGDENLGNDAIFGWKIHRSVIAPIYTASWLNKPGDSLWLTLNPQTDVAIDSLQYPFLTGILRNTVRKISNGNSRLFFWPLEGGRCDVDPDSMSIPDSVAQKLRSLGYVQGWNAVVDTMDGRWYGLKAPVNQGLVCAPDQFPLITVRVDTLQRSGMASIRRSVALNYQPQYLRDSVASRQLIYDAVMFASLSHLEISTKAVPAPKWSNGAAARSTSSIEVGGAFSRLLVKQRGSTYDTRGRRLSSMTEKTQVSR